MPPRGDQAAERRGLRRLRIGVEALRIPVGREGNDFFLRQRARAVLEHPARREVLPVVAERRHSRSSRREAATPNTSPQNGAPMRKIVTSATVTRKQTSAPKL